MLTRPNTLMEREELHHSGLDVLTPWTFKGPQIVSRLLRFNARQIHLRRALRRSGRALIGVFSIVYSQNVIFDSPVCRREYWSSQPPTLTERVVGDVPQYAFVPVWNCAKRLTFADSG
jgi:hypothetical protein